MQTTNLQCFRHNNIKKGYKYDDDRLKKHKLLCFAIPLKQKQQRKNNNIKKNRTYGQFGVLHVLSINTLN